MNDKAQPSEWNDKKECPYCTKTMNWGLLYHLSAFVRNQVGPLSLTFSTIQYISMELKGIYSQYNPPPHPQQTPLNIDLTNKQNGNISCTLTVSTIFKTIKPPFIHCQIHHIRDTCPPPHPSPNIRNSTRMYSADICVMERKNKMYHQKWITGHNIR